MGIWIQYHNHYGALNDGNPRLLPCGLDQGHYFTDCVCSIGTNKKSMRGAIGDRALLIVGVGEARSYFLWDSFVVENVEELPDGEYEGSGRGWMLSPPQRLNELDGWTEFHEWCGHFGHGFKQIDNHQMCDTLTGLADEFRGDDSIGPEHLEFADCLVELLGDRYPDPFAFALRGHVLMELAGANPERRDEFMALAEEDFNTRDRLCEIFDTASSGSEKS